MYVSCTVLGAGATEMNKTKKKSVRALVELHCGGFDVLHSITVYNALGVSVSTWREPKEM